MTVKKTLQQREMELQALLATVAGKKELQGLAARYSAGGAPGARLTKGQRKVERTCQDGNGVGTPARPVAPLRVRRNDCYAIVTFSSS
jgi:hypothetical protein